MSLNTYVKEKALFRKGQLVSCLYYPGVKFKVVSKQWNGFTGTVRYSITRNVGTDKFESFPVHSGLRNKDLVIFEKSA